MACTNHLPCDTLGTTMKHASTVAVCVRNAARYPFVRRSASPRGSQHPRSRLCTAVSRRTMVVGAANSLAAGAVVASVLAIGGAAMAASVFAKDPRTLTRQGMDKFRQNLVEDSVADFDAVIAAEPRMRPYMWQRGLSLYYLGRYEEGAKQFRDDVAVNPNDTEESIWAFLCEAQLYGAEKAREEFLQVGRDPRPVMRAAYECFRTGRPPQKIMDAVADRGGHDTFYGLLYVGLWHEAHQQEEAAKTAITSAVATPYAQQSGDYMAALAKVHCLRRGWLAA